MWAHLPVKIGYCETIHNTKTTFSNSIIEGGYWMPPIDTEPHHKILLIVAKINSIMIGLALTSNYRVLFNITTLCTFSLWA